MKWEYKTVKLETGGTWGGKFDETQLDAQMNSLGYEEWELVAAFDTNQHQGRSLYVVVIFKRLRKEQ